MTPEPCPDRHLVALTGIDVLSFLQGLVSNDLLPLAKADGLIWTALLTPQGKYLADFFVGRQDGRYFLDLPATLAAQTLQRLGLYRLRADVKFSDLELTVGRGLGAIPAGAFWDPRHEALGWRSYGLATGPQLIDWTAIRVDHVIPETGIELIPNESYPLETGFERLSGVDFRKGCYVGQEVTARMKHKIELRKGLVKVNVTGSAAVGTRILSGGREAGTLYSVAGHRALAYLRFDWAIGAMKAGDAQIDWDGTRT